MTPTPQHYTDSIPLTDRHSKESVERQISIPETITALDSYPPLLRIPSEIRREIFRYVLPSSDGRFLLYADCDTTVVSKKWNRKSKPHPDKDLTLDILSTISMLSIICLCWISYGT
jgi:hypothetical protein